MANNYKQSTAVCVVLFSFLAATVILLCTWKVSTVNSIRAPDTLAAFPNEDFEPSIFQVLVNKHKFHGNQIRIEGYLHLKFEDCAIYVSKDDAEYGLSSNGIWVSFGEELESKETEVSRQFDGRFVAIEGVFNRNKRGHGSAWQGTLEQVSRIIEHTKEP